MKKVISNIILSVIIVAIIGCDNSSIKYEDENITNFDKNLSNIENNNIIINLEDNISIENNITNQESIETENIINNLTQTINSNTTTNQQSNPKISGRVVDGEIKNANIFFDLNKNGILDNTEPHTKSDSEGYFQLYLNNKDNYQIPIVSIGGFDIREGKPYTQTLMAFREKNSKNVILTPISTLIASDIIDNLEKNQKLSFDIKKITLDELFYRIKQAKKDIANVLELQEDILTKDPIKLAMSSGNLDLLKTNMKINKIAKEIKKGIKKELKNTKKDAIRSFKALSKALKKARKQAKKGDKALEEAINNLSEVEPDIFDKKIISLIKESTQKTIKTFNESWQDNQQDIIDTLKDKKKEFSNFNKDETAPTITLNGDNPLIIELKDSYTDLGAVAIDDKDGLVEVKVTKNSVDINEIGDYEIVYEATDSSGNSATVSRVLTYSPCLKAGDSKLKQH